MSDIDVTVCNVNREIIMISLFEARNRKARTRMTTSNKKMRAEPEPSTIIAA
jgi:hypothetical protein